MTTTTFATAPKSRRATAVPGDTLRTLTVAAKDVDGRTWPKGTQYQPSSHGDQGVTVTIIRGEPLPHCNDAQGWDDYRTARGYSGTHH